jgi:DNA-directed RNA polymerase sigma subunit (sigma70/sigma32)
LSAAASPESLASTDEEAGSDSVGGVDPLQPVFEELLSELDPRQALALRLRLGLALPAGSPGQEAAELHEEEGVMAGAVGGGMAMGEVAAVLGVSRQRVGELLRVAVAQLRPRLERAAGASEELRMLLDAVA